MKTHRKVKKRWIVLAVIILVLVVILGVVYLLQQDNIKAVANARKYTQEQLLGMLEENRQIVEEALTEQYPELHVRDLTDDERTALREGTLSREELIAALLGLEKPDPVGGGNGTDPPAVTPAPTPDTTAPIAEPTPEQSPIPSDSGAPEETPIPKETEAPEPEPPQEETYSSSLAVLIAEVYVMREEYTSQLDAMVARAKDEYHAMPKSERTRSKLIDWASGYITEASELEKQCDSRMDDILAEVKALAEKYGEDTEIVDTLANFYAEEKSVQKSLYIQELERRGIL